MRLGETESGLRRRRIRRRAQRRSLTDPRPPPNDQELRWKSRQRYSDDSGSESDDEQQQTGSRYHQQRQQPNYVSDNGTNGGANPVVGLNQSINAVQLEPLKLNELHDPGRSQSTLSNVGTESSGQKDSGFSDLVGRSEEDTMTVRPCTESPLRDEQADEDQDHPDQQELSSPTNHVIRSSAADEESSRKRTFLLRRTKSERRAEDPNPCQVLTERIKYKADIPMSVIRAAQAKTRKYFNLFPIAQIKSMI